MSDSKPAENYLIRRIFERARAKENRGSLGKEKTAVMFTLLKRYADFHSKHTLSTAEFEAGLQLDGYDGTGGHKGAYLRQYVKMSKNASEITGSKGMKFEAMRYCGGRAFENGWFGDLDVPTNVPLALRTFASFVEDIDTDELAYLVVKKWKEKKKDFEKLTGEEIFCDVAETMLARNLENKRVSVQVSAKQAPLNLLLQKDLEATTLIAKGISEIIQEIRKEENGANGSASWIY